MTEGIEEWKKSCSSFRAKKKRGKLHLFLSPCEGLAGDEIQYLKNDFLGNKMSAVVSQTYRTDDITHRRCVRAPGQPVKKKKKTKTKTPV